MPPLVALKGEKMMDVNTRRANSEMVVLRGVVAELQALAKTEDEEGAKTRVATYYPNPQNPHLIAMSVGKVDIDKIGALLSKVHEMLAENRIGVMLDAVVLKPLQYRTGDEARTLSLKKTLFLNFSLSTWVRENIAQATAKACPNDKFYDVANMLPILDSLEADLEVLRFEQECEKNDRPVRKPRKASKPLGAPLITADQARSVMESLGLAGAADALLPALGIMPSKKGANNAEG